MSHPQIERRADFSRRWDNHAAGESAQFWWLNRGKHGITLDLRDPTGRSLLSRLLERADVLGCNMSPCAASRLGLNGEGQGAVSSVGYRQISGYGAHTGYRDRRAYDMLIQAESGMMSLTGLPDHPARVGVSICDVSTGIYSALLVLAALIEPQQTGRGRLPDVSMFDVATEFTAPMLLSYLNAGVLYPRLLDQHHAICPYGFFRSTDDQPILLAVHQDDEWMRLCEHFLGAPELARDPRFGTNTSRVSNRADVNALVSASFRTRTRVETCATLQELGLAYADVNDIGAVASHPALGDRSIVASVEAESGDLIGSIVGIAERAFETSSGARLRPPALGEDTDAILRDPRRWQHSVARFESFGLNCRP